MAELGAHQSGPPRRNIRCGMFLDELPTDLRYDTVIVGAGPAGLSCAMALAAGAAAGAGRRIGRRRRRGRRLQRRLRRLLRRLLEPALGARSGRHVARSGPAGARRRRRSTSTTRRSACAGRSPTPRCRRTGAGPRPSSTTTRRSSATRRRSSPASPTGRWRRRRRRGSPRSTGRRCGRRPHIDVLLDHAGGRPRRQRRPHRADGADAGAPAGWRPAPTRPDAGADGRARRRRLRQRADPHAAARRRRHRVGNESGVVGRYLMEHPQFVLAGEVVTDAELQRLWPAGKTGTGMHVLVAEPGLAVERGLLGAGLQCSRKTPDHDVARFLGAAHRPDPFPLRHHGPRRDAAGRAQPRRADRRARCVRAATAGRPLRPRRRRLPQRRRHAARARRNAAAARPRPRPGQQRSHLPAGGRAGPHARDHPDGRGRRRRRSSTATAASTATPTSSSPDRRCSRAAATPTRRSRSSPWRCGSPIV